MPAEWTSLRAGVDDLAEDWRAERTDRQARRQLDPDDFDRLRQLGFLRSAVPVGRGGLWQDVKLSTRPLAEVLRALARVDSSVALVSAMHPAVVGFWLATVDDTNAEWCTQRDAVIASAAEGRQWGTITSEPGSGGDIARTNAVAAVDGDVDHVLPGRTYRVTGTKHFGSGSGVTDFMITTARPEDDDTPAFFALDVRGRPWDGSAGIRLLAEWDGVGMAATQSHAMRLEGCPAVRMAWPGPIEDITGAAAPLVAMLFTSVIQGILDEAIETARAHVRDRSATLRAYEQVEWTRAEIDHWLAVQAFDGALRTIETGDHERAIHAALRAKQGTAEIAEATLSRLARVIGGGTFSRRSPFSGWYEDVRALGFLRPPWGLAYDNLYGTSLR
jgi:alkylation response protein AidB-like acyl-CoA dehydrogenase